MVRRIAFVATALCFLTAPGADAVTVTLEFDLSGDYAVKKIPPSPVPRYSLPVQAGVDLYLQRAEFLLEGRIEFPKTATGPVSFLSNSYVLSETLGYQADLFRNLEHSSFSRSDQGGGERYELAADGTFSYRQWFDHGNPADTPSGMTEAQLGAGALTANTKFFVWVDSPALVEDGRISVSRFSATFTGAPVPEPTAALLYAAGFVIMTMSRRRR